MDRRPLNDRARAGLADLGIVIAVAWYTLAQYASGGFGVYEDVATEPEWLGFWLCLAVALPLLVRRRWPWPVFAVTTAAGIALLALGYAVTLNPAAAVMLFTFASAPDRGRVWPAIAVAAAAFAATVAIGREVTGVRFVDYVAPAVVWTGGWIVGDRQRTNRLRAAEHEERLEREHELRIAEERTRIARDLHDSAGHAINNVLVQAGAARLLHERDPERSLRAIATIEEVARETLGDIDRIVAVLRDGGPAERAPLPGTEAIPRLVARHREAGLAFELVERGDPGGSAPQPVERAAYRIAQEALTNAARHGEGSATIVVERGRDQLALTVTNPIRGDSRATSGGGLGIVGMRERAGLLGGEFNAAAHGREFRVRAVLPYEREAG